MVTEKMSVQIKAGLESRPIAVLVQIASQFESKIYVESGAKKFNAKSIMGMMTLGLCEGEELTVIADGADEEAAIAEIKKFLSGAE